MLKQLFARKERRDKHVFMNLTGRCPVVPTLQNLRLGLRIFFEFPHPPPELRLVEVGVFDGGGVFLARTREVFVVFMFLFCSYIGRFTLNLLVGSP